jgi:phage protein D
MKTPRAEIKVNGKPVASLFNERLISVTIVDKEGVTSDTISCDLNDEHPFAAIPKKGDTIEASLGYLETGVAFFGRYTCEDPEVRCLPYAMTVNGKGANMRDALKQRRARHWDKKTVKDIVSQIASENGLSPVIDDDVSGYTTDIEAKLKPKQSKTASKGAGKSDASDSSPPASAAPTIPDPTPPSIPGGIGHA